MRKTIHQITLVTIIVTIYGCDVSTSESNQSPKIDSLSYYLEFAEKHIDKEDDTLSIVRSYLEATIRLDSNCSRCLYLKGTLTEDESAKLKLWTTALRRDSLNHKLHYQVGNLYSYEIEPPNNKKARYHFRKAYEILKNNDEEDKSWLARYTDYYAFTYEPWEPKAIQLYSELIEEFGDPWYLLQRGQVYQRQKRYNDALQDYLEIYSSADSVDSDMPWRIAACYDYLGNYKKAISFYNKTLKLRHRQFPEANEYDALSKIYMLRGESKMKTGDYYGAQKDFNKALENVRPNTYPYLSDIRLRQGLSAFDNKEFVEAIKYYDDCIEQYTGNRYSHNEFGQIERTDDVLAEAFWYRGSSYYNLNQKSKACMDWSRAGEAGATDVYDLIKKYCN